MITFNLAQATQLLAMFGGEDAEISVDYSENGYDGAGLYAWFSDYPEEGSVSLDPSYKTSKPKARRRGYQIVAQQRAARHKQEGD